MKNKPVFLDLFEGCYGRLRNGEIVGPLTQSTKSGMITNGGLSWYSTGTKSSQEDSPLDILEIVPEPEKLPEPFECEVRLIGGNIQSIFWDTPKEFGNGPYETYRCKVTPIERVK